MNDSSSAQEAKPDEQPQGDSEQLRAKSDAPLAMLGRLLREQEKIDAKLDEAMANQKKIEARLAVIEAKQEMKKFKGADAQDL
jgi:hypothetical protein